MPVGFPPTLEGLKGWLDRQPKASVVGFGASYHDDPLGNYLHSLAGVEAVEVTDSAAYLLTTAGHECSAVLDKQLHQFVLTTDERMNEPILKEEALAIIEHLEAHPQYE